MENNEVVTVVDLLIAAMKDAAIEKKLTQFKMTITPEETGKVTLVRVIVVPEAMHVEFEKPIGTA